MNNSEARTLSVKTNNVTSISNSAKKPFVAKGHDAILKSLQDGRQFATISLMSDGSEHKGKIVARDKFTITLELDGGYRRTFYKHAIESFGAGVQ